MVNNAPNVDFENLSILVVDDAKSMRLTIRKMLKNLNIGKTLRFAEDGRKGIEILKNYKTDLAILDFDMPVMNGAAMLSYIRSDKALRDMPVIMITAEAQRDLVYEVAETDIDAYILKPLTLQLLDDKIKAVVNQARYPDTATSLIRKARDFEEAQDFESAIKLIKLALGYRPNASRLLRKLGILYQTIGNMPVALKCLKKAVLVNSEDAVTRYLLGEIYRKRGDIELAAHYYFEVMSLTSKYNDKAIELGELLLSKGLNQTAIKLFSKVISKSKKNLLIKEKVADICLEYDEYTYSKRLLDSIILEVPSRYDTVYKAGIVYQDAGDPDTALEHFLAVDRHQSSRVDVKLQIAKIYYGKNQVYQADDYLNRVLRKEPQNEEALSLRRSI